MLRNNVLNLENLGVVDVEPEEAYAPKKCHKRTMSRPDPRVFEELKKKMKSLEHGGGSTKGKKIKKKMRKSTKDSTKAPRPSFYSTT